VNAPVTAESVENYELRCKETYLNKKSTGYGKHWVISAQIVYKNGHWIPTLNESLSLQILESKQSWLKK
jgi:hypothetical protein